MGLEASRRHSYEGNIITGEVLPRAVQKAASGDDLWPEDVETTLMGSHDNAASRVYRYSIGNRRRIRLSSNDRLVFAKWLALFMPRVPSTAESINNAVTDTSAHLALTLEVLRENRPEVLETMKTRQPDLCRQITELLGDIEGDKHLMDIAARRFELGVDKVTLNPADVYNLHVRRAPLEAASEQLLPYSWHWLRSDHGFIIGDDPFLRWHAKSQNWRVGISKELEITFPISSHLCLLMVRRKHRDSGQIHLCSKNLSIEYNRRQRLAATTFIYGKSFDLVKENVPACQRPELRGRRFRNRK